MLNDFKIWQPAPLAGSDAADLRRFMDATPSEPPLTADQEAFASCDQLISSNVRLAVRIASMYAGRGVPLEELLQAALIALWRAAQTFDAARGRFTTYGARAVGHAMLLALDRHRRGDDTISLDAICASGFPLLAHVPSGSDTAAEALACIEEERYRAFASELLSYLDLREMIVMSFVIGGGTLAAAGEYLGVSRQRAGQLAQRARRKMRVSQIYRRWEEEEDDVQR